MDRQPAKNLQALLSVLDPGVAEPGLQPLERLVTRPRSGDALIVAIVGSSGVGKSAIMNALAGDRVVTAGPLRPTTTEIAIWGDVDASYLPGLRVSGPEPTDDLVLVDTPAGEHFPDAVALVFDRTDAVLFVLSPERYADAITVSQLTAIRERGIPMRVALSVGDGDSSDFGELAEDARAKLETPIDVIVSGDVGPLEHLLGEMSRDRDDIIAQRDRGSAAFSAMRARQVADILEEHTVESEILVGKADEAFAGARVDHTQLAAIADEEWGVAAPAIVAMTTEATDRAISELGAEVAANEVFSHAVADAAGSLPSVDIGPIDSWHSATTDVALASIKRRRLHPLRTRAVRDEMWRLAVDFDRSPSKRVRKALRDRLPEVRFDRGAALSIAVSDAGSARVAAFRRDLDPSSRTSADEVRLAADAVAAAGAPSGEVSADVA